MTFGGRLVLSPNVVSLSRREDILDTASFTGTFADEDLRVEMFNLAQFCC